MRGGHLYVCQVKEVLTGSMRRKEIRVISRGGMRGKEVIGEIKREREKKQTGRGKGRDG